MDQHSIPPRIATVQEMAGILATQRAGPATIKPIGRNWVWTFIKHYDNLQSKFNYKYNY